MQTETSKRADRSSIRERYEAAWLQAAIHQRVLLADDMLKLSDVDLAALIDATSPEKRDEVAGVFEMTARKHFPEGSAQSDKLVTLAELLRAA